MNRRTLLATVVAVLATPGAVLATPAASAARGPAVTVRVEGLKRTLLASKVVRPGTGSVRRFGAPAGACPEKSAQGALDLATRHRWGGTWDASFGSYEILTILGEKHPFSPPKYFWELFANNVPASVGACEQKLRRGQQLLFAAVPDTGNAYVTATRAPGTAVVGIPFTIKVVWFNAKGHARPLAGARVTGNAVTTTTNSQGVATVIALHPGALVLHASHAWSASTAYVRAAPVTVHVS